MRKHRKDTPVLALMRLLNRPHEMHIKGYWSTGLVDIGNNVVLRHYKEDGRTGELPDFWEPYHNPEFIKFIVSLNPEKGSVPSSWTGIAEKNNYRIEKVGKPSYPPSYRATFLNSLETNSNQSKT